MKRLLAQSLNDYLLRDGRGRGAAVGRKARRALVAFGGDPVVKADVAGTTLEMPLSHELPHYRRAFAAYSENLGHVTRLVRETGGVTMVDVGANVGDSAAIAKAYVPDMAILCIDADARYMPLLHANTSRWRDVEVAAPVLLDDVPGEVTGTMVGGSGTSYFDSGGGSAIAATTLDDLLGDHPRFARPALIKSDTDGFEARVLRGAAATIVAAAPVLFVEYDPKRLRRAGSVGLDLLAWLRSVGYWAAAFYDNFGTLLARCTLDDERLLADLDQYVAEGTRPFHYYDVVLTTRGRASVIEGLSNQTG